MVSSPASHAVDSSLGLNRGNLLLFSAKLPSFAGARHEHSIVLPLSNLLVSAVLKCMKETKNETKNIFGKADASKTHD